MVVHILEGAAALCAVLTFVAAGLWKLHQALNRIERHTKQLTPNGGSHIADAINRLEKKADSGNRLAGTAAFRVGRLEQSSHADRRRTARAIEGLREALIGHIERSGHFDDVVRSALAEHGITVPDPDSTDD